MTLELTKDQEYMKEQEYIIKFDKFRKQLTKQQNKLTNKEKHQLYNDSLKTGNIIGIHILNNYIDLEFGLIDLD